MPHERERLPEVLKSGPLPSNRPHLHQSGALRVGSRNGPATPRETCVVGRGNAYMTRMSCRIHEKRDGRHMGLACLFCTERVDLSGWVHRTGSPTFKHYLAKGSIGRQPQSFPTSQQNELPVCACGAGAPLRITSSRMRQRPRIKPQAP